MANFKIVISDPKATKAYQKEIDQAQSGLMGKRIGDKFSGNHLGLPGYELEVTGGSDKEGFPMRKDVEGPGRKKILLSHGPGFHPVSRGRRKRKSIRGNTISPQISQINMKIVTYGTKPIEESLGVKKEHKEKEEAEGGKAAFKPESKPAEKPEHEKKEHKKEEHAEKKPEHAEKPKEEHAHAGEKAEQKEEGAS